MDIISYTKPTWEKDQHNAPILEEKKITVAQDLKLTLGEIGTYDFFTYMPVKYIEAFFKQIENDENADFTSYLNNFHSYFPGGYRAKNKEILSELDDENSKRKLQLLDDIEALLQEFDMNIADIEKEETQFLNSSTNSRNFYRKVRPLYISLRNKGYTHNDLRS